MDLRFTTRTIGVFVLLCVGTVLTGCGNGGNSVVAETDEYSYQDLAAQITAEEAAASAEDSE